MVTCVHRPDDIRIMWKECRALSPEFDLTLIAPEGPLPPAGIDFEFTPIKARTSRWTRFVFGPVDCFSELRRGEFDLVHAHDPELLPLLWIWKLLYPRTVVLYDAHESLAEQVSGKQYIPRRLRPFVAVLASALLAIVVRKIDGVVAATPKIASGLGGSAKPLVVQNFPWLSDYPEPTPLDVIADPTLCYVGAISDARGREAMAILADRLVGASVSVAGNGHQLDKSRNQSIQGGNINYLGRIPSSSVPSFIAAHSVGLALLKPLPNYLWSQPTKLFEYMASGRPFVASDLPRWRELFGELDAGLLVNPQDPEEVEAAVRKLLETPGLARDCGLRGRRAMVEKFSFEVEAKKLTSFYRDLLGARE